MATSSKDFPLSDSGRHSLRRPEISHHSGFDLEAIAKAYTSNSKGRKLRGASTISQQTAKNLFLWPTSSYLRKAIEVYFTLLLELVWDKERIIEVYLNVAEFGPGIYGAEQASREVIFTRRPTS